MNPTAYLKAILGALAAGLAALVTAAQDGGITLGEWLTTGSATVVAFNLVFWPPNTPPSP